MVDGAIVAQHGDVPWDECRAFRSTAFCGSQGLGWSEHDVRECQGGWWIKWIGRWGPLTRAKLWSPARAGVA